MSKKHKDTKEKHGKGKASSDKEARAAVKLLQEESRTPEAPAVEPSIQAEDSAPVAKPTGKLPARQITLISKALADPTRMAVLRAIAKGGATCSDMRDCAGVSAATLSHHMKELESAGLIEIERKGRFAEPKFQRKIWKKYLEELGSFAK